jgi:hypothetical protein
MTAERLYCRCGGEVRIVRLTPRYLTLGHVRNPKDQHHVVRLARSGPAPAIFEDGGNPGRSEVPELRRGAEAPQRREVQAVAAPPTPQGSRSRSSVAPSSPAGKARSSRGCPPAPAPRLARSAGRSDTAGD